MQALVRRTSSRAYQGFLAAQFVGHRGGDDSDELAKFFRSEPRITNNSTHRERVNGIMAGYCDDMGTIGHDDVLPLTNNEEARFLKGVHRDEVIDARDLGHPSASNRDF